MILEFTSHSTLEGIITMTAPHIADPGHVLGERLAEASPDMMRSLLQTMPNALLSADADAVVGAEYSQPTPGRVAQRNGTHDLVRESDAYRVESHTVRPHQALAWNRPSQVHRGMADPTIPNFPTAEILPMT